MFILGNFLDKTHSRFLKILKLPLLHLGNFEIFKSVLRQFILDRPPKHVITSTNRDVFYSNPNLENAQRGLWVMCPITKILRRLENLLKFADRLM